MRKPDQSITLQAARRERGGGVYVLGSNFRTDEVLTAQGPQNLLSLLDVPCPLVFAIILLMITFSGRGTIITI